MRRKELRRTDSPSTSCFRQSELQSIFMRMRLFAARPRRFGNHAGRLLDRKPFTGSPGVLLITTQGRPAHLTCGQTISRIIVPPPGVLAKRLSVASFRSRILAPIRFGSSSRAFRVARLGGNVPAWLVFDCQAPNERPF